MIKVRTIAAAAVVLFPVSSATAGQATAAERITPAAWAEALENAARLSGDLLRVENARPVDFVHLPIEHIRKLTGLQPHACAYDRENSILYCRDDRPWQTDQGHHGGILVHEAAHAMQPAWMPGWLREIQAYVVQIAWLEEHGESERAAAVASEMQRQMSHAVLRRGVDPQPDGPPSRPVLIE